MNTDIRKTVTAIRQSRISEGSVPPFPPAGNPLPRKRVQRVEDIDGSSRPTEFVLRPYGERLFRQWKNGQRIRQIARNTGTTVDFVESVLREAA